MGKPDDDERPNMVAALRAKFKEALQRGEYRLIFPRLRDAGWSIRKAAEELGVKPPSSLQSYVDSNPLLAKAWNERRDVLPRRGRKSA